ncbi:MULTISPECIES: thioesterase II family protein [Bacillus]|uniref:Alpha/beta fold hydrolase n=1 Tax=Bacillus bingmayongensis TaxID=1150157 RepID=A0ABU5JZX0_9BACI|nr:MULTISPECIES: alpha/beta fold hydrolase [Bacillus]MBY0596366.1 alpha/beta fold hydrolase [Bacillus bingmayongensis]MDZ5608989.1 alpha/beta fold hydrolase [Bacillus pseudomycoides]SFI31903.1 Surfactin synthase thioesterase subunit [Bacillus sp. 71mf]SFS37428.1 Surfactin synthase thioesterase subunit [Bacillus sp. 103mf]
MKLFCLPYAGSSSTIFSSWKRFLDKSLELVALELPGHGTRMAEPLLHDVLTVVEDLYLQVQPHLSYDEEFAIFGHSMGSLLAYELQRKIKDEKKKEPVHVFFSGRFPPHIAEKKVFHQLPDNELKEAIINMGGVPEEYRRNHQILDFFIPVLRADFQLLETYKCQAVHSVQCDISIFYGKHDLPSVLFDLDEWGQYTKSHCRFYEFNGDHFFINQLPEEVVSYINNILNRTGVVGKWR